MGELFCINQRTLGENENGIRLNDRILERRGTVPFTFYEKLEQSLQDRFSRKTDDQRKIEKIFADTDLVAKKGNTIYRIRLKYKVHNDWGIEYVFNVPLGITFSDCLESKKEISNALNKRVEMSYGTLLHVKVF
jgi:hypothetical protein